MKNAIVVASIHEATSLITRLNLKKIDSKFDIYKSENITLIISGIGKLNSAIATSHLLSIDKFDTILNFGICASRYSDDIKDIFLINKIVDNELNRDFYPDILLKHPLKESAITTANKPIESKDEFDTRLVDMECSSYFFASSKFLPPHKISTIKIVSDDCNPTLISKDYVHSIIEPHIDSIIEYIYSYSFTKDEILTDNENMIVDTIAINMQLSFNQKVQLQDRAKYLKLNSRFDKLLQFRDIKTQTKQESKVEFARIKEL
jgi:nucleoside phosphorylase